MPPASPPSLPLSPSAALLSNLKSRQALYWFGPAFVASIAYIDPGNFATNFAGGTSFGYKLLWVLLWSNLMAILIQYLSAKLGIATGRTLPQNCREHFSRRTAIGLWVAAELSALATDLAEFLGAALGFYLLFGGYFLHLGLTRTTVMFMAAIVSAVCVFAILALELRGFRSLEIGIMVFVLAIGICYLIEIFLVHPDWGQIAYHTVVPMMDRKSIYIAVGMLGATVMPHVVYLHSGLVQPRLAREERSEHTPQDRYLSRLRHLRLEALDVFAAMNGAWLVNSAMIIVAAAAFSGSGRTDMSIEEAHRTLGPLLGPASATIFAVALSVLRPLLLHRGNPGRADDSGRIPECSLQHLFAPASHAAARDGGDWAGSGPDQNPGSLPGGAQLYLALCSDSVADSVQPAGSYGQVHQWVDDCFSWLADGDDHYCPECGAFGAKHRLSAVISHSSQSRLEWGTQDLRQKML